MIANLFIQNVSPDVFARSLLGRTVPVSTPAIDRESFPMIENSHDLAELWGLFFISPFVNNQTGLGSCTPPLQRLLVSA